MRIADGGTRFLVLRSRMIRLSTWTWLATSWLNRKKIESRSGRVFLLLRFVAVMVGGIFLALNPCRMYCTTEEAVYALSQTYLDVSSRSVLRNCILSGAPPTE